jgi:peptidoglycan/xylan/chitin deacetylase (PgdA/CDA1 family)
MLNFQFDRQVTLNLLGPLIKIFSKRNIRRIPILMYHSISNSLKNSVHPYYQTSTSPDIFRKHMRFLYESKYSVINIQDFSKSLVNQDGELYKAVILTFDDGFKDFYKQAFPILERYGFSASVFLPTAYIGRKPIKFLKKECLTWDEVRLLRQKGIIFGSHTVNHFKLYDMKMDDIQFEIGNSKKRIEHEIEEEIDLFSYPFAFPEQDHQFIIKLKTLLLSNGYKRCLSTIIGTENDQKKFYLKRIPVNNYDDFKMFKAKLEGLYDWVHSVQYLVKTIKSAKARYIR